jgi:hypothetical protein
MANGKDSDPYLMNLLVTMSTATAALPGLQPPGIQDGDPDVLLLLTATRVLRASGYGHVRDLRCAVAAGVVTLSGIVPSYYLKQVAQEAVLRLDHVREVKNRVNVCKPAFASGLDPDEKP